LFFFFFFFEVMYEWRGDTKELRTILMAFQPQLREDLSD